MYFTGFQIKKKPSSLPSLKPTVKQTGPMRKYYQYNDSPAMRLDCFPEETVEIS